MDAKKHPSKNGYRWEVKKVVKPGETEPVIQMHLVPPEHEQRQQQDEHARLMTQLRRQGYITLPDDLASAAGFQRWDPSNQEQTARVLAEMAKGAEGEGMAR